ncbi:MAG: hypothetical protein LBK71_11210 [Verrucomicrobiales bacterium]|jgi:hypothetical protein|nr:hypothetical protein [Verrucomicrobiales bacterium]
MAAKERKERRELSATQVTTPAAYDSPPALPETILAAQGFFNFFGSALLERLAPRRDAMKNMFAELVAPATFFSLFYAAPSQYRHHRAH